MKITCTKTEMPLIQKLKKIGDRHDGIIKVCVHDGKFHADDCLAIVILKEALPEYQLQVTRSRRPAAIHSADIALDVGGGEFDHHQEAVRYQNGVPMASCGKILEAVEPNKAMINLLNKQSLYAVQAIDNGERATLPPDCRTNLFEWVGAFNPTFEERTPTAGEYYDLFLEAINMTRRIYKRMRAMAQAQLDASSVLNKAPMILDGRFVELPSGGVPWHQFAAGNDRLIGVLHPELDGTWKVVLAPKYPGSKELKVSFPVEWGGLEGLFLETVSSIKGAIFCHLGLHLAGFKTKEGALQACRLLNSLYHLDTNEGNVAKCA